MLKRRRVTTPHQDPTLDLLADLLVSTPDEPRLRAVALRSLADQRRSVLAPYPLRTWFDQLLRIGERALGIVVIGFFVWWLADGYGRDWWHARSTQSQPIVAAAVAATPDEIPASDPAPSVAAHPELGALLPIAAEPVVRPNVTFDYLVPAQMFVAAPAPTPEPAPAPPRDLRPTHVAIASIGLNSSIVEVFVQDGTWQVADYAVGYHHGTGIVGLSNMVLAGHKGLRGGVFRDLERINVGDEIVVTADGEQFRYRVRTTGSVWPNQVDVMYPTQQAQLTLLTCTNWDMQRFVVVADFVGSLSEPAAAGGN